MASILHEFLILDPSLEHLLEESAGDNTDVSVTNNPEYGHCDISLQHQLNDSTEIIASDFIQDLFSESSDYLSVVTPSTDQITSGSTADPIDVNSTQQVAAPASPTTTCSSSEQDDVLSILSQDDGYGSLTDCSASISELIDLADYDALLETLTSSILASDQSSESILGDACYNLSQCTPQSEKDTTDKNTEHMSPDTCNKENDVIQNDPGHVSNKPDVSYIEMIANALMKNNNSLLLNNIYEYIMKVYPYYKHTTNSWRTSIRHNLSVNECFTKGKRTKNGRGFFWSVHSACIERFEKGDFDRRKARQQVQHCNRAFSSALDEMTQLTNISQPTIQTFTPQQHNSMLHHAGIRNGLRQPQMMPMVPVQNMPLQPIQYQQCANIIAPTAFIPMSSTPNRSTECVSNYQYHHGYSNSYYGYY